VAPTAEEMEAMANEEEEERELSRAIETIRATTTAGRAVKETPKAIQHQADMANQGVHRGGHRGGNWGEQLSLVCTSNINATVLSAFFGS
jgi:hypothetical protein